MNYRHLCVFDFETGSPDPDTCQIVQIAGCIIHDRRMKIVDKFTSWVRPDWDDTVGVTQDTMEWHAEQRDTSVSEFKKILNDAPPAEVVWPQFTTWIDKYNKSKVNLTAYNAPVPAGYNILGFDMPILERYCALYGPTEKNRRSGKESQRLLSSVYSYDLMHHMWFWTENIADPEVKTRLKLADNIKVWMGFSEESIKAAHDAWQDVYDTAKIIIKIFAAQRHLTEVDDDTGRRRLEMKGSFNERVKV